MKTIEQIESALAKKLDPLRVKEHPYSGYDYLTSWDVIKTANEIFGYFGWSSELIDMRMVSEDFIEDKDKYEVSYLATVKVTLRYMGENGAVVSTSHMGSGHDAGTRKKKSEAHGMAIKNAESDAEKRALRKLGNQFGLPLYDKEKEGLGSGLDDIDMESDSVDLGKIGKYLSMELERAEKTAFSVSDLDEIVSSDSFKSGVDRIKENSSDMYETFKEKYKSVKVQISQRQEQAKEGGYL